MPKNHHEIMNQNEEEKQPMDKQKFTLIKKSMNKPLIKGNITSTSKYKNNREYKRQFKYKNKSI